uniref:Uncharacterized protein n=1 Tax=Panagrolaimus superbus TaxID=310955 RepID=A0A914Z627_9BILA
MFIKQSYPLQNTYEEYTRDRPRRSTRERSQVVRYQSFFKRRSPSRQSRRRSTSRFLGRSRSASKMSKQRRSFSENGLNTHLGTFRDNLYRRSFITGCIRPPTPDEVSTLCNFITTLRTHEIELFEQINRAIKNPSTNEVFAKVINNLKAVMDTSKDHRRDYEALKNTKETVDISVFVVFFWNMFDEIVQRNLDVIYYSGSKMLDTDHQAISTGYKDFTENLKGLFQESINSLEMTDDSFTYFEKYKA